MVRQLFLRIFNLNRFSKNLIQLVFDFFLIIIVIEISFILKLGSFETLNIMEHWVAVILTTVMSVSYFAKFVFFRSVIRYLTARSILNIIFSSFLSAVTLYLSHFFLNLTMPLTITIIYFIFLCCSVTSSRIAVRYIFRSLRHVEKKSQLVIYGAGDAGKQLAESLRNNNRYHLIAFIDDDIKIQNISIFGKPVISYKKALDLIYGRKVDKVCLALPSATEEQKNKIVNLFSHTEISIEIIPGLDDLLEGRFNISDLRPVEIEDLLGRSPVPPNTKLMSKLIKNKTILVTGAGGSIGSELCYQIIQQNPKSVILIENNEFALYKIQQALNKILDTQKIETEIIAILANVQDPIMINNIFNTYAIDSVYHAAAYKHVPLIEYNIIEGVRNNVFGTLNILRIAINHKIKNFTLISTDKAVRPTNIMGATKRFAELICQGLASGSTHNTLISMVRFGNVLGSSGSVIPTFQEQIEAGGPITVTHPDITRYFMSIKEAAQLVIQASSLSKKGGEVFLLDMGKPVKIIELAKRMIKLSGATPVESSDNPSSTQKCGRLIKIEIAGLRPGEKLTEELLVSHKSLSTRHPRIMMEDNKMISAKKIKESLDFLDNAILNLNIQEITEIIINLNIGYNPQSEIVDYYFVKQKNG